MSLQTVGLSLTIAHVVIIEDQECSMMRLMRYGEIGMLSKCHGIDNRQYQVSRDLATRGVFKSTTILFLTRLLTAS